LVFLTLSVILAACTSAPTIQEKPELNAFAQCLTEQGATMYGTEWCPHCKDQKAIFGSAFEFIDYVDCEENKQACLNAGIRGYPSWVIDGEITSGIHPISKLAQATGCTLTTNT